MTEKRGERIENAPGKAFVLVRDAMKQAAEDALGRDGAEVARAAREVIDIAYDEECMFDQRCHENLPDGQWHAKTCPLERLRIALGYEVTL